MGRWSYPVFITLVLHLVVTRIPIPVQTPIPKPHRILAQVTLSAESAAPSAASPESVQEQPRRSPSPAPRTAADTIQNTPNKRGTTTDNPSKQKILRRAGRKRRRPTTVRRKLTRARPKKPGPAAPKEVASVRRSSKSRTSSTTPASINRLSPLPSLTRLPSALRITDRAPNHVTLVVPKGLRRLKDGSYAKKLGPVTAHITAEGDVYFRNQSLQVTSLTQLRFDMTDAVIRSLGDDPYAQRKQQFLRETRTFRAQLRKAAWQRNWQTAKRNIFKRLRTIWYRSQATASIRKKKLFKIWDGVYQGQESDRRAAGEYIRAAVLHFIKTEIPRSSVDHYTTNELRWFKLVQTSSGTFQPYQPYQH
ncbi:MAG: hypothetical protein KTR25_10725 [Myxococcales bacterium]|nr:hypothetical protein [Myxococcales bacterium]